jgi:hypothetical protein
MASSNRIAREYSEQAHRRARTARLERLNGEGPTDGNRQGPKQKHQLGEGNKPEQENQLSDHAWFGIDALAIIVDNDLADSNGRQAGQGAARECAKRWLDASEEVQRIVPKAAGADLNDCLEARHG